MGKIIWTYEKIKEYIEGSEGNGCLLLSTKEEFEKEIIKQNKSNAKVKLKILCGKCGKEIFYTNFETFKSNKTHKKQCNICGYLNSSIKQRLDGNKVYNNFIEAGLIPKFNPKDYKNGLQELPFICSIHMNRGIQYVSWHNLYYNNCGCKECTLDKHRGKNHWKWSGGESIIKEYLRQIIYDWKNKSMKLCNYKCTLTNKKFDNIHHLYGFDLIVKELIKINNVQLENKISAYSIDELEKLKNDFIKLHSKYPLGICLCESIHKLFHSQYGFGNNTPQQFKEFVTRLESGEFNDFLQENNLTLNINYEVLNQLLCQDGQEDKEKHKK